MKTSPSRLHWRAITFLSVTAVFMLCGWMPSQDDLALGGSLAVAVMGDVETVELKKLVEEIGRTFEEFKQANDLQIKELKSGKADVVLTEKIDKLNDAITTLQEQKDEIEKKLNRPGFGSKNDESEEKSLVIFNNELKAAAIAGARALPKPISIDQYRDYKRAFNEFARKGWDSLGDAERKAMTVGTDSQGGYLVPADVSGRIVTRLHDLSPIRQIASVQTISSDALEGIEDINEADAGWTGETSSRTETSTPDIGKWRIPAEEMYAKPKATQKLLDDAAVDIEAWLSMKVADKLARLEGAAFINGNGIAKPRGFATYTTAETADASRSWGVLEHVATGVNGDFAASNPADDLMDLISAFKPQYLNNANWVTRRTVIAKIRKFKEATTNAYLWQPGLQAGQPATLLGFPIVMAEDMPALAEDSLSLALGDFSAYQIVDRLGIRVLRDPFTDKPYVVFYTTKRTGGGVLDFDAIKFIKFT
jgi:HK97 family phage major capsid protein